MLAIEPVGRCKSDEELRPISVWACICHGEHTSLEMLQLHAWLLICELSSIDRETTSTVSGSEITTLCHEAADDAMEVTLLVSVALGVISCTQRSEVFSCLGDVVLVQLENHLSKGLTITRDCEEDLRVLRISVIVGLSETSHGHEGLMILAQSTE